MRKLLLLCYTVLSMQVAVCQDSAAATYINNIIEQINGRLSFDILERKDTAMYDRSGQRNGEPLQIHTEYYTDYKTMKLDKVVEVSRYKDIVTQVTVYFKQGQPIRLTSVQQESGVLKADFDIYFMNSSPVHVARRQAQGQPNGDAFLRWCYELLNDYKKTADAFSK